MAKARKATLSAEARTDIAILLRLSERSFGKAARMRYQALLKQALNDIGADPSRPGSKQIPELMIQGICVYHLAFSRSRVVRQRVKSPRHLLLYRVLLEGVVEIVRVLHDGRDMSGHLPED